MNLPTVWASPGRAYALGDERGRGGEAVVYDFASGLAKIYRPSALADASQRVELREKIEYLTRLAPLQRDLRFAAPMLCLYSDPGCREFAGIAMRCCKGVTLHRMVSLVTLQRHFPRWDRLDVARAAASLVAALAALESQKILVADINPGNFLVDPATGRISCIDCDSYQVSRGTRIFASRVFTPRYASAEVLEATSPRPRTLDEYHYSCAILLFEVLTFGLHPHAVRWGEDPVSNIRSGRTFIGGRRATGGLNAELFMMYNCLHPAVKHLCVRTFIDGHRRPECRPNLVDWQWALREQTRSLENA